MTKLQIDQYLFSSQPCNGRLTLESGVPISTSDQSAKTTLYFTPFKGNYISFVDGTLLTFSELSLNISAYTASKPYDIFAYNNSGVVAIESLVWTNGTTRATGIALTNGVYYKTGDTSRRYIGTIYINSNGGQCDDSITKRFVWNYYNRTTKKLKVIETTDSWNYTTAVWRSANNSTANRAEVIIGVSEDLIRLHLMAYSYNLTAGRYAGIGIDSTSSPTFDTSSSAPGAAYSYINSFLNTYPSVGYHYYQWLEYSDSGNTTTWYGDAGAPTLLQSGMNGVVFG